jgi:dCTP diphosphatase
VIKTVRERCDSNQECSKLHSDTEMTLDELKMKVKKFLQNRGWETYHNPKNLAASICIEAAELLEVFQWVSLDEAASWNNDPSKLERVKEELADIIIYCLSMANTMKINLTQAVLDKLEKNQARYPVKKYFGEEGMEAVLKRDSWTKRNESKNMEGV